MLYYLLLLLNIQMSNIKIKNKTQKLTFKLAPYLFMVVAIYTAFGSGNGSWIWIT